MATRERRLAEFDGNGEPPADVPVQVLCEDHSGTYQLPFVCRWVDGEWRNAELETPREPFAWQRWRCEWHAARGDHELACRATDAQGAAQPPEADWNIGGMGNNGWHRLSVTVR